MNSMRLASDIPKSPGKAASRYITPVPGADMGDLPPSAMGFQFSGLVRVAASADVSHFAGFGLPVLFEHQNDLLYPRRE